LFAFYYFNPICTLYLKTHSGLPFKDDVKSKDRKYALTLDEKFTEDLLNFPSFAATVGKKPSDIPYDK
jgi:hypothetical protein